MKANFDFNRLSESRKQELDRMVADFSEAGCLFVEDLFLEFLIDADNGIDRSDDKLVATFDDECGHELVFILSQEEVHYVIHAISEKLDNIVCEGGTPFGEDENEEGMLTINALTAADSVIIPVQAQYLPAKGLEQLLRTITRVKRQLNPKLEVDGIVLTMVDSRTTLAREINALVRKTYGGHVFASEIPRSIKAAEISVENKSIYDHDRSGKAALAYENLTREVLSLGKQIKRHRTDPVR